MFLSELLFLYIFNTLFVLLFFGFDFDFEGNGLIYTPDLLSFDFISNEFICVKFGVLGIFLLSLQLFKFRFVSTVGERINLFKFILFFDIL